ncbi:hypothetical protein [Methanohalobium evestigatum]|uniref:hypothetical protein n=1 Tax=Methanohalobium evestigatum TaxID=2322 RepID=UPI0012F6B0EA|nr:hypothetical protein [Methanohalobium evestigatum]
MTGYIQNTGKCYVENLYRFKALNIKRIHDKFKDTDNVIIPDAHLDTSGRDVYVIAFVI